ncbi:hypothetical protein BN946_scf185020.g2 [Trametes cinnabarina]|uniref:Uncharacterized protein n=1 Tax=Pycnoporus cinnabarinus TaxID=5643 RepID=A0A060SV93_PYCCI|nr:hypothetical protein BN946_scf185020.g2 [Trametes cinnabarina]
MERVRLLRNSMRSGRGLPPDMSPEAREFITVTTNDPVPDTMPDGTPFYDGGPFHPLNLLEAYEIAPVAPPREDEEMLFEKVARVATVSAYVARNLHDYGDVIERSEVLTWLAMIQESLSQVEEAVGIQGAGRQGNTSSSRYQGHPKELCIPEQGTQQTPSTSDMRPPETLYSGILDSGTVYTGQGYAVLPSDFLGSKKASQPVPPYSASRTATSASTSRTSRICSPFDLRS